MTLISEKFGSSSKAVCAVFPALAIGGLCAGAFADLQAVLWLWIGANALVIVWAWCVIESVARAAPATTGRGTGMRGVFADIGCDVEEASPDLSGADEVFQTLRGVSFVNSYGALLDEHPGSFKDTIVWNIRLGRALTGAQSDREPP